MQVELDRTCAGRDGCLMELDVVEPTGDPFELAERVGIRLERVHLRAGLGEAHRVQASIGSAVDRDVVGRQLGDVLLEEIIERLVLAVPLLAAASVEPGEKVHREAIGGPTGDAAGVGSLSIGISPYERAMLSFARRK